MHDSQSVIDWSDSAVNPIEAEALKVEVTKS
jgi:hypothetical protein